MADIKGLDQVLKNLNSLPKKIRDKSTKKAVGKGAAIIRKKAKANALMVDDHNTGRRIADNVGQRLRSKYFKATGNVMVSIGILSEKGRIPSGNPDKGRKGNTPHWHLVEEGTEKMPAQPFLRPAAASSTSEVFSAIARELEKEIGKVSATFPK